MRPLLIFREPSNVRGRQWVLQASPQQIHDEVCTLTQDSTVFPVEIEVIPPRADRDGSGMKTEVVEAMLRFISGGISAAATNRLWALRGSIVNLESARIGEKGRSLSSLLLFLERVTCRVHITMRGDRLRQALNTKLREFANDPLEAFVPHIAAWYASGGGPRTALLEEYEVLHSGLRVLGGETEALGPKLRRLVGSAGRLSVGPWACDLSRGWQGRTAKHETPNEWAEALLSIRHRKNIRQIKEQLAEERSERQIAATWSSYGRWVQEESDRQADWQRAFGKVVITSS